MALQHANSGEVIDLRPLGESLAGSKSHAIVRTPHFEAMRLVIPAGSEIPTHEVDGPVMVHCIEGCVRIGLGQDAPTLRAGHWLYLEGGESYSFLGVEDASLLMTILFGSPRGEGAA